MNPGLQAFAVRYLPIEEFGRRSKSWDMRAHGLKALWNVPPSNFRATWCKDTMHSRSTCQEKGSDLPPAGMQRDDGSYTSPVLRVVEESDLPRLTRDSTP
jgi:hypothetical protein